MKNAVIAVVAIIVLAGGAVLLTHNSSSGTKESGTTQSGSDSSSDKTTSSSDSTQAKDSTTESGTSSSDSTGSTITYDGNSFSPSKLTVKSGTTVTIKNTSSNLIQFNSDPHPAHTDNPELNVGSVKAGGTGSFTANTKGTWGYHDHLNPSETGTVVVD